jgi:ornithine carbamoyltransferase
LIGASITDARPVNRKENVKHFLSITDLTVSELMHVLTMAKKLKAEVQQSGKNKEVLKNKTLGMVFEKPSLRTRLSFETGMTQLGGHAIYLASQDIGLGIRESIHDVSKVTSSMTDLIMARTFSHKTVKELAKWSSVPVINGLSDYEHPCQTLADLLTILEVKESFKGLYITFIGDGENNVAHSFCLASAMLGMNFTCCSPKGFWMNKGIVSKAQSIAKKTGAQIMETDSPEKTLKYADVVYTDTWVSMGDEGEKDKRLKIFKKYQVTKSFMKLAKKDAIFMHDLPAYRGNEVTEEVIDGKQSVVFQQAENRLHAQKSLMLSLLTSRIHCISEASDIKL